MIPTTDAVRSEIAKTSRTFRARFRYNGSVVAGDLMSLAYYTGACGEDPRPGSGYNSYVEATFDGLEISLYNKELELQIGVVVNGSTEYITVGWFTVNKTQVAGARTSFTAVGRLTSKCGDAYTSALTYPASLSDVVSEISSSVGVTITTKGLTVSGTIEEAITGETYAGALSIIAGLLGGFVTENYEGKIVIAKYGGGTSYAIDMSRVVTRPIFTESPYEVTGVKCVVEEGDEETPAIEYEHGTVNAVFMNAYMTQDLFNAMYPNYEEYEFYPANIDLTLGNPLLEPWDYLTITDTDSTVRVVPCHSIVNNFTGGFFQTINSELAGEGDEDNEDVEGPTAIAAAAALTKAQIADNAAASAVSSAAEALQAANDATTAAGQATQAAADATTAAGNASTAAASAASSANNALTQLSTVEKVVDTLTWISEHATYKASTDTAVVPGKYYFSRSGSSPNYTYSIITNPTGNPSTSGYYEIDTIDEAVSNYIETHLALDGDGLWLIPDDTNGNRVLIATGSGSGYPTAGTYIIDGNGNTVGAFLQNSVQIGNVSSKHIMLDPTSFSIVDGQNSIYSSANVSISFPNLYSTKLSSTRETGAGSVSAGYDIYTWASQQDADLNSGYVRAFGRNAQLVVGNGSVNILVSGRDIAKFKYDNTADHRQVLFYDDDGDPIDFAEKLTGSAGSSGTAGITLGAWKLCWGSFTMNTNSASGSGTFAAPYYQDNSSAISFSFTGTPYVWAQVQGSLTGTNFVIVTTTSTTGATIRLMSSHKNTNTRTIRWFAIGKA